MCPIKYLHFDMCDEEHKRTFQQKPHCVEVKKFYGITDLPGMKAEKFLSASALSICTRMNTASCWQCAEQHVKDGRIATALSFMAHMVHLQHPRKSLMRLAPVQDGWCPMVAPESAAATAFQGSSALRAEPLALGSLSKAYTAIVEPFNGTLQQMTNLS